ncbi:MAG: FAD-dependent monooxygenase [Dehalococcoidia bacterium]
MTNTRPPTVEIPVLIAGGGPVGFSASIMLSRFGVRSLLVERHPGTSIHPKARGINARTMEVLRQFGVEQAVRDAGLSREKVRYIIWTRSLAGEELERRTPGRSTEPVQQLSPTTNCLCAQDDLEPVLRTFAEAHGPGQLRFNTEVTGFRQNGDGVTATVVDRSSGRATSVRAQYLIAADGARSRCRELLGIQMQGEPALYRSLNILLRADLTPWVADRPSALYFVEQPGLRGTFLTINGVNRWGFLVNNLPVDDERSADLSEEQCIEIVRRAAGVPDLEVEILGAVSWVAAAQVAERYQEGRVFLTGDAAHHMPPTGGFGMNTGIQDVHNLAWKLAAVLDGWAAPALLDSYAAELLPHSPATTEQSLRNATSMGRGVQPDNGEPAAPAGRARPEFLNEQGMIYGAVYDSAAVIPDGTPLPVVANAVTDYLPVARPGSRAPHVWLQRGEERLSTLDLFGDAFVLLVGRLGSGWQAAGREVARVLVVPLQAYTVGMGSDLADPDGSWRDVYDIEEDGAVLVRPDGHVAWRCRSNLPNPAAELHRALTGILGRMPAAERIEEMARLR